MFKSRRFHMVVITKTYFQQLISLLAPSNIRGSEAALAAPLWNNKWLKGEVEDPTLDNH